MEDNLSCAQIHPKVIIYCAPGRSLDLWNGNVEQGAVLLLGCSEDLVRAVLGLPKPSPNLGQALMTENIVTSYTREFSDLSTHHRFISGRRYLTIDLSNEKNAASY